MTLSDLATVAPGIFKHRKIILSWRIAPALVFAATAAGLWHAKRNVSIGSPGILMVASVALGILFAAWLFWNIRLLPWQKRGVARIRLALDRMEYRKAHELLDRETTRLRLVVSTPARIELELLWADYHTRCKNDIIATHEVLQRATTSALLPWEVRKVTIRWLQLYWMTGSHGSFRRLLRSTHQLIAEHEAYPLLCAWDAEIDGDFQTARAILKDSIARKADRDITVARFNNLGRISLLMGNRIQAGDYYRKAADAFEVEDAPYLYVTVYHNLLMRLLQDGYFDEARKTIKEYRQCVDWSNYYMVLDFTNTVVEAARQLKDFPLLLDAYALVNVYAKPMLSRNEFIAHMISELRIRSNDNLGFLEHVMIVRHLFSEILALPFADRHAALREIVGALKPLAESVNLGPVYDLFLGSQKELADSIEMVDRQRRDVPTDLMNVQWHWISVRIQTMKYRADMERQWTGEFFASLFGALADLFDLAASAENRFHCIYSRIMLIDEYIAYESQLGTDFSGSTWREKAEEALAEAEEIHLRHAKDIGLIEFTVGLAWGFYRLMGDRDKAKFWINKFDESGQSAYHYASWWRRQYKEVKNWVE